MLNHRSLRKALLSFCQYLLASLNRKLGMASVVIFVIHQRGMRTLICCIREMVTRAPAWLQPVDIKFNVLRNPLPDKNLYCFFCSANQHSIWGFAKCASRARRHHRASHQLALLTRPDDSERSLATFPALVLWSHPWYSPALPGLHGSWVAREKKSEGGAGLFVAIHSCRLPSLSACGMLKS